MRRSLPALLALLACAAVGQAGNTIQVFDEVGDMPEDFQKLIKSRGDLDLSGLSGGSPTAPSPSDEPVEALLAKGDELFAPFEEAMGAYRARAPSAAAKKDTERAVWIACSKARLAYQAAFERDESHPALVHEQLAARLMALHEGSLLHPANNHIDGKKKAQTQASLLNMIARIGNLAVKGTEDANRALGKRWLSKLMHLHFEARSSKWREYKVQLIDAGLLPEDYTTPAAETAKKDELR